VEEPHSSVKSPLLPHSLGLLSPHSESSGREHNVALLGFFWKPTCPRLLDRLLPELGKGDVPLLPLEDPLPQLLERSLLVSFNSGEVGVFSPLSFNWGELGTSLPASVPPPVERSGVVIFADEEAEGASGSARNLLAEDELELLAWSSTNGGAVEVARGKEW